MIAITTDGDVKSTYQIFTTGNRAAYEIATFALEGPGIRIQVPLSPRASFSIKNYTGADYLATLGCHIENNFWDILALPLKKCENGKFVRMGACSPLRLPRDMWMRSINVIQHITIQEDGHPRRRRIYDLDHIGISLFPLSRRNYILSEVYPPSWWNETRKAIHPSDKEVGNFMKFHRFDVGLLLIEGRKRLVLHLKGEDLNTDYGGISFLPENTTLKNWINDGPPDTNVINFSNNTKSCIVEGETFEVRVTYETRGGRELPVI
jgi:hypothetical protein